MLSKRASPFLAGFWAWGLQKGIFNWQFFVFVWGAFKPCRPGGDVFFWLGLAHSLARAPRLVGWLVGWLVGRVA